MGALISIAAAIIGAILGIGLRVAILALRGTIGAVKMAVKLAIWACRSAYGKWRARHEAKGAQV